MKSIKGTETEKNLLKSFAGESQAQATATPFFASQAKKEGYMQISDIFTETANQEKEHAERFFKFLEGGDLEITASFPAGVIGDTRANLIEAAAGEHDEWYNLYPAFAAKAREEGFPAIAYVWEHVVVAEKQHEHRYLGLLANVENGTVFKKDHPGRLALAATAATSTRGPKRRKPARPAPTRAPISRFLPKTGNRFPAVRNENRPGCRRRFFSFRLNF